MRAEYRLNRFDHNLHHAFYDGVDVEGEYNFPRLFPVYPSNVDISQFEWIDFDECLRAKDRGKKGVHFFAHDYKFERCWNSPPKYVELLQQFGVVCAPFFSTYIDWPKSVRIMNMYKNRWLGRYWQDNGLTVIPTVSLAEPRDFDWVFDGLPHGGIVAVSSVGWCKDAQMKECFSRAFDEMICRLNPVQILWRGKVGDEYKSYGVPIHSVDDICDSLKKLDQGWRHDRG